MIGECLIAFEKIMSNFSEPLIPSPFESSCVFFETEKENGLDKAKQTVHAVHAAVQSPIVMALLAFLSTAAVSVQGLVDVNCPSGGRHPVSLYILSISESGERKTSTDKKFKKSMTEFQGTSASQREYEYHSRMTIWDAKIKSLKKKIERLAESGSENEISNVHAELSNLHQARPIKPGFLFEDISIPALLENLSYGNGNAALSSSEGGIIFNQQTSLDLPKLNKMWDGDPLRVDRKSRQSFEIKNARLSITVMTQKHLLERFLKRGDGMARASGFLARCLVIEPTSTQGHRFNNISQQQAKANARYTSWFDNRVADFLRLTYESKSREREVISFSPEAANIWHQFYINVEKELNEDGLFSDVRDFASKISNNMSRIAAVLHFFVGNEGDIDAATAQFSADLCVLLLIEFKKLFGFKDPLVLATENANKLLQFLSQKNIDNFLSAVPRRYLLQYGPSSCRNIADLEAALSVLMRNNIVISTSQGLREQNQSIYLNPNVMPGMLPMPISTSRHADWLALLGTAK